MMSSNRASQFLAGTSKCLAQMSKSAVGCEATNKKRKSDKTRACPVLTQKEFLALVKAAGSDFYPPDDEQAKAVYVDPRADLFIVAGPGTGKTSCLSFRALYLILVAGLTPRSIIATTFTRNAAAELCSRVLGWGHRRGPK
jgi:UvrD/REP helicase N-terminal domain